MIFGSCDFDGSCEFYRESRVRVRKPRKCYETGRAIPVGSHAWQCVSKYDGMIGIYYQTDSAYHFARYLNLKLNGGECAVMFGEVDQVMHDRQHDFPSLYAAWRAICAGEREWSADDRDEEAEAFVARMKGARP